VALYYLPAGEWFAGGPEGVLFGRRYDLGLFAWLTDVEPPCDLYLGSRVPGPLGETFAATGAPYTGWGGDNQNNTGWANAAYDAACQTALGSLPGTPAYEQSHMAAQRILSLKVSATRPDVFNFSLDPTQNSELYNIYEYDLGQ
jgi:peptide/nickel transport system substrate-binding protein